MCEKFEENIEHFMNCISYGKGTLEMNWTDVFGNNVGIKMLLEKKSKGDSS